MPTYLACYHECLPLLLGLPNPANHDDPLRMMVGTTARVSTFVTVVGQPKTPTLAGNGGFKRGFPVLPVESEERNQTMSGLFD